ncbi:hypothetical protein TYRP_008112 [Tyrophagus putrescentiae]|nr:hypothetical protein TYRP_008112 [Tyrophagus putrescentiae]
MNSATDTTTSSTSSSSNNSNSSSSSSKGVPIGNKRTDDHSRNSQPATKNSNNSPTDLSPSLANIGVELQEVLNQKKMNLMKSPLVVEALRQQTANSKNNH